MSTSSDTPTDHGGRRLCSWTSSFPIRTFPPLSLPLIRSSDPETLVGGFLVNSVYLRRYKDPEGQSCVFSGSRYDSEVVGWAPKVMCELQP